MIRFTRKFIREFIHHSNAIEGYIHPEVEIDKILDHVEKADSLKRPVLLTAPYVIQQYRAIQYVRENKDIVPTLGMICTLHRTLMVGLMDEGSGALRWGNVRIGSHIAPKYSVVPYMLTDWINTWSQKLPEGAGDETLIRHYEFEHIHPFFDGNGRVGRLLMLWDCLHQKHDMDIIKVDTRLQYYDQLDDYRKRRPAIIGEWS